LYTLHEVTQMQPQKIVYRDSRPKAYSRKLAMRDSATPTDLC